MLKVDGAFAPVSTQRGTGSCRASILPPKRFVAAQLSGGLKILYKHLIDKKKAPHNEYGSQTDADGKFQPCYPVPLLAGRYKFVQVIGQGQSSILVAAEDTFHPDKKSIAVKIMHLDYSRLGAQEADCIQQLNKSDILNVSRTVRLFNVFRFEGHYCLVFELLRPRPLHQYFQRCQFDDEEAKLKVIRKITLQLLQALGFLKRENVIHADLKPENILFEEGEEIKIKVVDFGNAIHWVHREVSLYYDEFELQTLLYRAPEVMFGVPFGPEIDMWSLGCILAELYIGKPLFLGRSKNEILQQVTSVFGPIPRNPFQTGKFFQDLAEFVGHNPEVSQLVLVANLMKKLHNSRNYAFASFLVGLLQYNPSKRLTPSQAAMHPFLAPEFPCAYLLPQQGDAISDAAAGYKDILIIPEQYIAKPQVDEEIKRQHFSGTELLKRGTTTGFCRSKLSSPLITKQNKGGDAKNYSPTASLDCENVQCSTEVTSLDDYYCYEKCSEVGLLPVENSRYAMEGPLTTTRSQNERPLLHKEKMRSDGIEKKEGETSNSVRSGIPAHKNSVRGNQTKSKCLKLGGTERSDLEISQMKTRKSHQADTSQRDSNVTSGVSFVSSTKGHPSSENTLEPPSRWNSDILSKNGAGNDEKFHHAAISSKTSLELDKYSSCDEKNAAARTRVYYRKTKYRKLEQLNDLSQEIKCRKVEDSIARQREPIASNSGCRESSPFGKTSVVDKRLATGRRTEHIQLCQEQQEQDSEKAGFHDKYKDDAVMLL